MSKRPVIIGLVGGIGSGKSAVARLMGEMGASIIDADASVRAALDRSEVKRQLVEWWGPGVLGEGGGVNRRTIADVVFADERERRRLESLVHPLVAADRDAALERLTADPAVRAIVIDAPLLMEVGLDERCDRVVFVACDRPARLRRLAEARGWDEAELARREKNQLSIDRKLQRATDIVDNNQGESALRRRVRDLLDRILNPR